MRYHNDDNILGFPIGYLHSTIIVNTPTKVYMK